jgi:hypothetical protein
MGDLIPIQVLLTKMIHRDDNKKKKPPVKKKGEKNDRKQN